MKPILIAVAAVLAALAAATVQVASAAPVVGVPEETMFIENIDACPTFAPYGAFHVGYFGDATGEYLNFDAVTTHPGGVVLAVGDGVPLFPADGAPLPTSAYMYRVIVRVTSAYYAGVYGDMMIVRSDGSTVSGAVRIKTDGSHGYLLTAFTSQPTCRLH